MLIVRFVAPGETEPRAGVLAGDEITALAADGIAELLRLDAAGFRRVCATPAGERFPRERCRLLAPVDGRTEVWAAGVTYKSSQLERMKESATAADIYATVYDAERPELFFKSAAWRVSGPGAPIAVRADSAIDVPEPELALVCNSAGAVVGFTVCDDVSSRSIEGENPLYLPQAKIYLGGCALGPGIRPVWEVAAPTDLGLRLVICRAGVPVFDEESSTSLLRRNLAELVEHLFRADVFPDGVVLSTGTALVPPLPFTLRPGDRVEITVDGIGTLVNSVVRGKKAMLEAIG